MAAQLHSASVTSPELTRDTQLTQSMLQKLQSLGSQLLATEEEHELPLEEFAMRAVQLMDQTLAMNQSDSNDGQKLQKTPADLRKKPPPQPIPVMCDPVAECAELGLVQPLSRRQDNLGTAPLAKMRPLRWTKVLQLPCTAA